jgi:hypothetical protein
MACLLNERRGVVRQNPPILFALERRTLTVVELCSACVGKEAIETPGHVTEVEAEARGAVGPRPEVSVWDARYRAIEIFAGLDERVSRRLEERVDPLNWTSKPRFGHV